MRIICTAKEAVVLAKQKAKNKYLQWLQELNDTQKSQVKDFFIEVRQHLSLPGADKDEIVADFEKALLWYASAGVDPEEAMERLAPENLGGFYARPSVLWYPLDDAAKIYPLSMKHGQMAVFRLSANLLQRISPELLQMALNFTIRRFPCFATTVKKGFFWHYLNATKRRYIAEPERDLPVKPLKISSSGSQSFRVLYFENRISVEYFHILTDASGGMLFLKTLVAEYLRLLGHPSEAECGVMDLEQIPDPEESSNAFLAADRKGQASGLTDRAALQLGGKLTLIRPARVVQFRMDASRLLEIARSKNATITEYILATMFLACRRATDVDSGSFNIQVPVNMRKFYPTKSLRNFSMYCGIRLPLEEIQNLDSILPSISSQLKEKAALEPMTQMIHSSTRLVSSVRYIPLFIKAPIASAIYGFLGDKIFTTTLSNMGVIDMPKGIEDQIESMDFILGTAVTNRAGVGMVTYGNVTMLSITKLTSDPTFEEALYSLLTRDGLHVVAEGSMPYEN